MANTVSVTCYAQHSSYQNICLNKTIHQVGKTMSLFIFVFEQLWHTNINLRYFFIFNFYQNYTGGGFFVDLKHQRSLLLWVRTQNGYSFCDNETSLY